jgi:biopolymer transport protein ExbD
MVPMIDIISLLLMFLLVVGGAVVTDGNIQMKLPAASEGQRVEGGRIVVQLDKRDGVYYAVVRNKAYSLVANGQNRGLQEFLREQVVYWTDKGLAKATPDGAVDIPVKLRMPAGTPMREAERVVMTLAHVGLVHVQYAVAPDTR